MNLKRTAAAFAATSAFAALTAFTASPAEAGSSHENTNPSTTGCSSGAWALSTKTVSGGKAQIMVSPKCGTNWVRYSGKAQKTTKYGKASGKSNTRTEVDYTSTAWSMQSYAPGTTTYTGVIKIGSTTYTATCSSGCSWKTTTASSSTSLSSKVDSFVSKWNGKYADYDGYYGAQCVDLFNFYNRDVIGASRPGISYAYQLWDVYDSSKYTKVSASSTPRKGDVAIWSSSYPGSGGAGHVAIVLSTSGSNFTALSQRPGATKKITFSKSYVRGFLRPRS